MPEIGYSLSSEEFSPSDLIACAKSAEAAGFTFSLISDHFHPWTNSQPHSSFVWSVIGALSQNLEQLRVGTGVTCPIMRISPQIVAQAAATAATMMPGRFFLGVGTGEYLNEHISGLVWPPASQRLQMLEEAVTVIRLLWRGGWRSHYGKHYTVRDARIFTLPKTPPPIYFAASNRRAAELAGRCGDGLISFEPERDLTRRFDQAGGKGKPKYGQLTVCYAASEDEAANAVRKYWANAGIGGRLMTDLRTPNHFEEAIAAMRPEKIVEDVALGPDPRTHIRAIEEFLDAGFDHVYVHQTGPVQQAFIRFYSEKVLPHFNSRASSNGSRAKARKARNDRAQART
jgi:coenzyme F420-dependent glucose-6-phosphate dehydrogenase